MNLLTVTCIFSTMYPDDVSARAGELAINSFPREAKCIKRVNVRKEVY